MHNAYVVCIEFSVLYNQVEMRQTHINSMKNNNKWCTQRTIKTISERNSSEYISGFYVAMSVQQTYVEGDRAKKRSECRQNEKSEKNMFDVHVKFAENSVGGKKFGHRDTHLLKVSSLEHSIRFVM